MNLNHPFSLQDVSGLIGSVNDNQDWEMRVAHNGDVYMSTHTGAERSEDFVFGFEAWDAGNGWVGPEAAQDQEWVTRVYNALKAHWPPNKNTFKHLDLY